MTDGTLERVCMNIQSRVSSIIKRGDSNMGMVVYKCGGCGGGAGGGGSGGGGGGDAGGRGGGRGGGDGG